MHSADSKRGECVVLAATLLGSSFHVCTPQSLIWHGNHTQALFKRTNSAGGSSAPLSLGGDGHGRDLADLKAEDRSTLHQVCNLALPVPMPSWLLDASPVLYRPLLARPSTTCQMMHCSSQSKRRQLVHEMMKLNRLH